MRELDESKYEVVAGAGRLRAAKIAELEKVPVDPAETRHTHPGEAAVGLCRSLAGARVRGATRPQFLTLRAGARSGALAARGYEQPRSQMRLARAALAHEHHRLGVFDVAAFGQFANLCRRNLPCLIEVELLHCDQVVDHLGGESPRLITPCCVSPLQTLRSEALGENPVESISGEEGFRRSSASD